MGLKSNRRIFFLAFSIFAVSFLHACGEAQKLVDAANSRLPGKSDIQEEPIPGMINDPRVADTDPETDLNPDTDLDPESDLCLVYAEEGLGNLKTCGDSTVLIDENGENETPLAEVQVQPDEIILIASKKNGGAGGSKFYDADVSFEPARDIVLPRSIPILEGNAGNSQKLYLHFGGGVICAYYSQGGIQYRNPRCFKGANIAPGSPSGFAANGEEIDNDSVADVTHIRVQVNGAAGKGVLTRVEIRL